MTFDIDDGWPQTQLCGAFFSSQNSCDALCDLCRSNEKVLPRQEGLQSLSFANGRFYPGTESIATADVNYCH